MRSTSSKNRTLRAAKPTAALLAAALALALTGCGGSDNDKSGSGGSKTSASGSGVTLPKLDGQTLEVAAVWTGAEQKNFMKVMDEFKKRTGAKVNFVPTGNNTSTFHGT